MPAEGTHGHAGSSTWLGTVLIALVWSYFDEVGFWKKVLSAQERSDLHNGGLGNTHTP